MFCIIDIPRFLHLGLLEERNNASSASALVILFKNCSLKHLQSFSGHVENNDMLGILFLKLTACLPRKSMVGFD